MCAQQRGLPSCPWCPGRGCGHRALCSRDDAGLLLPAGSQAGHSWLPAMPCKAEMSSKVRYRAAGKRPSPQARANKQLEACPYTKVMGTFPGEQWGQCSPAVGTGQEQLSSMEVSWGGQRRDRGPTEGQPPWGLHQSPSGSWGALYQHY